MNGGARVDTPSVGKLLIVTGVVLVVVGTLLVLVPRLAALGLGRLPGDIVVKRGRFTLYLPLATCLLLSAIGTLVLWLIARLRK